MRDYLTIGSSPYDEPCIQVTDRATYSELQTQECYAFVNQLRREFGEEPEGARLAVKRFPHDFGAYREVVCWFDSEFSESVEYAYKLEGEAPAKWDSEAIDELKKSGVWDSPLRK